MSTENEHGSSESLIERLRVELGHDPRIESVCEAVRLVERFRQAPKKSDKQRQIADGLWHSLTNEDQQLIAEGTRHFLKLGRAVDLMRIALDREVREKPFETLPLAISAIITPGERVAEGTLVKAVPLIWNEIVEALGRDWSLAYKLPPEKLEEIVAGHFTKMATTK
jgi:hypothetical protein